MAEYIIMPSYTTLAYMIVTLIVGMFVARVAQTLQERSERRNARVDLPLALKAVRESKL